jgi:hypothetical protein
MHDTQDKELSFVIPTYRLREVGATLEEYDEHVWRNGHSVRLMVFFGEPMISSDDDMRPYSLVEHKPAACTSAHQTCSQSCRFISRLSFPE